MTREAMVNIRKYFFAAILAAPILLFSSCLGVEADVKISASGSGAIDLEYRMSEELVAFGELDANKTLLPVPVSRSDFERGISAYKGLKLESWSDSKDGTDLVVKARVSFDDLSSLTKFLDPRGNLASYSENAGKKTLRFVFGEPLGELDAETAALAAEALAPYSMKLTLRLPSPPTESTARGEGTKAWIEGQSAKFESSMKGIALSPQPAGWTVSW